MIPSLFSIVPEVAMKLHSSRARGLIFSTMALLVLATGTTKSQGIIAAADGWPPIDPADLALKAPLVEADADAEVILWDVRVDDTKELTLSHYLRVKLFTKRGCDNEGKVRLSYPPGVRLTDVAARTVAANGSVSEVPSTEIFDSVLAGAGKKKWRETSFAFRNVEPGALVEYKWKEVVSKETANGLQLEFQRNIPVQTIRYHIKPGHSSEGALRVIAYNMPPVYFNKETDGSYSTNVKNMKAFHPEPLMPPEETVRSWAMINYSLTESEGGYIRLATGLYFGLQPYLKIDDAVKAKSAELVRGAATQEEKLDRISTFCRANITNVSDRQSGFSSEDIEKMKENKKPADTLKRGMGTAFDINLLFAALVSAEGYTARVALLSDRGKTFFRRSSIVPGSLRPSIVAVVVGRAWKFFDPGYHYLTPGMLRWQEEGVDVLVTDPDPVWAKTPLSAPDKSKELRAATLKLDENGTLEGDVSVEYSGHFAVDRKEMNEDDSPNQREETLKQELRRLGAPEVSNILIQNVTDPIKPFVYRYHIRVPDYAQRTGKRIFLQPAFFQKGEPSVFSAGERKYPLYFHFPWSEDDTVSITLPQGYVVESADAPAPISAGPATNYVADMQISKDGTTIVYHRNFVFGATDKLFVPVASYGPIKLLFDQMNQADNFSIILKPDR